MRKIILTILSLTVASFANISNIGEKAEIISIVSTKKANKSQHIKVDTKSDTINIFKAKDNNVNMENIVNIDNSIDMDNIAKINIKKSTGNKGKKKFAEGYHKYDREFKAVADKLNIPVILLKAVTLTENAGFKSDIKMKNTNGTYDYGLTQINTIWLKKYGLSEKEILKPIYNIFVSGVILKDLINRHGPSLETIGRYHSATPKYKKVWLSRFKSNLVKIAENDIHYQNGKLKY